MRKVRSVISSNTKDFDNSQLRDLVCEQMNQFLKDEFVIPQLEYEDCLQKILNWYKAEDFWKLVYCSKRKDVLVHRCKQPVSSVEVSTLQISYLWIHSALHEFLIVCQSGPNMMHVKAEMFIPNGDLKRAYYLEMHENIFDKQTGIFSKFEVIEEYSPDHMDIHSVIKTMKPLASRDSLFTRRGKLEEDQAAIVMWASNNPKCPPMKGYIREHPKGKFSQT